MPSVYVENVGPVPKFLVEASQLLETHAQTEGLFRKSGSLARQKELRNHIEAGQDLSDANPLDLGSVVKQFFRELPEPLLTNRLHDTFIRAYGVEPEARRLCGLLLLCHLLPWHNLCVLRFMMAFLYRISTQSDANKMDILNLAVCLAPNLLYSTCKSDKLSQSDSQLLQIQTNIVQILITHADAIGTVSESLVERTNLMGACFPSEDELDRSDGGQNDSKSGKKKKKRSASFQGLMSNLSNSFSKWRKDVKHHNQSGVSERSAYSFTSVVGDKSSLLIPDQPDSMAYLEMLGGGPGGYPDMTPKMIRKRKAEHEAVPFSASKKQAILQSMPQMSALGGTPFTPATVKRGAAARAQDFYDTPTIQFSQVGADAIFAATPRMKMDRHLSTPSTSCIDKRKSPGKGGCFSPKTPRNGVRRTMRGFLKRLSGGKESQLMERSASSGECPSVVLDAGSCRKKSLFRKHRKTPSSPARLITPLVVRDGDSANPTGHLPLVQQLDTSPVSYPVVTRDKSSDQATDPQSRPHERRYSADGSTPLGGTHLKRGRPNTLYSGLPSPSHRKSLDRNPLATGDENKAENNGKFCFATDKYGRQPPLDCVASTVDTSPILKAEEAAGMDGDGGIVGNLGELDSSHLMTRHTSATSMTSMMESDHDRAFIHESMFCIENEEEGETSDGDETRSECSLEESDSEEETSDDDSDESPVFKIPETRLFYDKNNIKISNSENSDNDVSASSSVVTVIQTKSGGDLSTGPHQVESLVAGESGDDGMGKPHTHSVESLDSAIDCVVMDSVAAVEGETNLKKCVSLQSVESFDSGLSVSGPAGSNHSNLQNPKVSSSTSLCSDNASKTTREVLRSLHDDVSDECSPGDTSVLLQRRPSIRSNAGAENKLRISKNTHQLLSRAGKVASLSEQSGTPDPMDGESQESPLESSASGNVYEKASMDVAEASMEVDVDHQSVESAVEEISARRASPLRFPNSVSRQRGSGSPVRIPTIFAKADTEAATKYRGMVTTKNPGAIRMASPNPKRPFLPLTTNLVNASSVLQVKCRLNSSSLATDSTVGHNASSLGADTTAGHTPCRLLTDTSLHVQEDTKTPCHHGGPQADRGVENGGNARVIAVPAVHTPVIKGGLFSTRNLTLRQQELGGLSRTTVTTPRVRSPVKPVKRLQGGAKSPKKLLAVSAAPRTIKEWSM